MKRLWLLFFPLLFLPNFGASHQTSFGTLEISDWLIVPFIVLLLIAPSAKYEQRISQLKPFLWAFLVWALLSTLTIHFRYDYLDDTIVIVGACLKLCRLALYVAATMLIARALADPAIREKWMWSLVAALVMLSIGLLVGSLGAELAQASDAIEGYKSYNLTIVSVAILCAYIVGLWIDNVGTRLWSACAALAVGFAGCAVMLSSSMTSHGRGGWLAFAVGFGYILWKRTQTVKALAILVVLAVSSAAAYEALPSFKSLVDATLSPAQSGNSQDSVDDGARISTWRQEAPKFVNAPLLGTGFYHRGGETSLWASGSHNFLLQMFLETGAVGGSLMLVIFILAWRQACHRSAVRNKLGVATQAALIAAFTGGMSGEYYYGGIGVLVLFAVFAMVGSLPTEDLAYAAEGGRLQPMRWRMVAS
jgi:O-antigen ligase